MHRGAVHGLPESDREGRGDDEVTRDRQLSGEVIIYGSTLFLTFGTFCTWFLFRDPIEDVIYGGRLFSLLETSISLGDVTAVILWTVAYYFASPWQLLLVFLGRFETDRPSDWILYRLGSLLNRPVDEGSYVPGPDLYAWMIGTIVGLGLATALGLKAAFGDATWGVSTGLGACMAAGVFEVSRPQRISAEEKETLDAQFEDFVRFAEARLQRSGSCHESEIFRAFRTEVPGYRDKEALTDITLRLFVQQWAPGTGRTSNGFCKKLSLLPRVDPFQN